MKIVFKKNNKKLKKKYFYEKLNILKKRKNAKS